jgi:hypothetical protein
VPAPPPPADEWALVVDVALVDVELVVVLVVAVLVVVPVVPVLVFGLVPPGAGLVPPVGAGAVRVQGGVDAVLTTQV